jgi:hypothetical protein
MNIFTRITRVAIVQHLLDNGKRTSLVLSAVISMNCLLSQINGWPSPSHGSDIINSNRTWGEVRARVTSVSGATTKTLSISNVNGSFASGDWVIVIQMLGSGMGSHTLAEVKSVGSTSVDVTTNLVGGYTNSWPTFSFGTNDRVQIVKVHRYWNLTINSGIITCPAFDFTTGTGGILPVMVGNNFIMNGGYFNAHAKGFHHHFASGGGLGIGGAGSPQAPSHIPFGSCLGSHTASVDQNTNGSYSNFGENSFGLVGEPDGALTATGSLPINTSNNGDAGGQANNSQNPGTSKSGETFYWFSHSSYPSDLHLGCSGKCGSNAGKGAGGGGFGGTGGQGNNNASPVPGTPGVAGNPGGSGGNTGSAGVGGGIIFLKVANSSLNFSNNHKRFYASASSGHNGGNGGSGGRGGKGGLGSDGQCVGGVLQTPGGVGGYGDGGIGADGGDAGTGGCGGTIWIVKKSGGTHATFSPYVNNSAGAGGKGGAPGYTPSFEKAERPKNYSPLLGSMLCNPGPTFTHLRASTVCVPVRCDCDEVYRHLGVDMNGAVTITTGGTNWAITKAGQAPVYWNQSNTLFYNKVVGACTTKYECRMKKNSLFIDFMNKAFAQSNLQTYTGAPLNIGINKTAMSGINTQLYYGTHLVFEYDPNLDRLTDIDNIQNPYVDVDVCPFDYDKTNVTQSPIGGGGGGGGEIPPIDDEILIISTPTGGGGNDGISQVGGNFEEELTSSAPPIEEDYNHGFKPDGVLLNEVGTIAQINKIDIKNNSKFDIDYYLYNMDGKMIYHTENADNFTISNIATGLYLLILTKDNVKVTRKLYVH